MSETIPAVFENGVFRPLRRPHGLVEHHQVTLTVEVEVEASPLSEVTGSRSSEDAQDLPRVDGEKVRLRRCNALCRYGRHGTRCRRVPDRYAARRSR